jgi:adenosine deaminase
MGLSEVELVETLHTAIDAAFTSAGTKARLRARLVAFGAAQPGGING